MFDGEAFGAEIVMAVKSHIAATVGPMQARIEQLEAEIKTLAARKPEKGEQGPQGLQGERGDDGVGLASSFIDRLGQLVLTFTDGTVGTVGQVVGTQGPAGVDGKNGVDGKDGADGVGFDDMSEELADDGRTLVRRFVRGETVKEFRHTTKIPRYRGVYKSEIRYDAADMVTRGGSVWFASVDTSEPPGAGAKDWILCVKQGERGRNGIDGARGEKGEPGKDAPVVKQKVW